MRVSVIIPNYNYDRYVGIAIDSALNLDWPDVEVIVVDDGSTDDSRAVIGSYGDRITAIHKTNSGQTDACSLGFAACQGEAVIFLDSDDVLSPSLIREVAAVWHPGVAKVQCQMEIIDGEGRRSGSVFPRYRLQPTPANIRLWASRSGAYPTPPGSANVYAADRIRALFPLDPTESASDSHLLAAAPFLGDVVTIVKPLVSYRVHGKNDGALAALDGARLGREITRAAWRFRYAQAIAKKAGIDVSDEAFNRSMTMLAYRLSSLRVLPERHPIPRDSVAKILRDFIRAVVAPQGLAPSAKAALLVWALGVATLPQPMRDELIMWRFSSVRRPVGLKRLLTSLGIGR